MDKTSADKEGQRLTPDARELLNHKRVEKPVYVFMGDDCFGRAAAHRFANGASTCLVLGNDEIAFFDKYIWPVGDRIVVLSPIDIPEPTILHIASGFVKCGADMVVYAHAGGIRLLRQAIDV